MQITKIQRKVKCTECHIDATYKLVLGKTSIYLCQDCLKQIYKTFSHTIAPASVISKFYIKR